jgi:hypothetical protein
LSKRTAFLKIFVVLLDSSREMQQQYLKISHYRVLPYEYPKVVIPFDSLQLMKLRKHVKIFEFSLLFLRNVCTNHMKNDCYSHILISV